MIRSGYCSITVANYGGTWLIRFVSKSYTYPWKSFANKLCLVPYTYICLFVKRIWGWKPNMAIFTLYLRAPLLRLETMILSDTTVADDALLGPWFLLAFLTHTFFFLKKILYTWSTKRSLFEKPFHGWVQLFATNLMTVINRWLATAILQ